MTAIMVIDNHALNASEFEKIVNLAKTKGNIVGGDFSPSTGDVVKSPPSGRVAKSKFYALLKEMSDDQIKATAVALLFDTKVQAAVKAYHKSVVHYTQATAIALELSRRGITVVS